jgi:hypothetical protein
VLASRHWVVLTLSVGMWLGCRSKREPTSLGTLQLEGYSDSNNDGAIDRTEYGPFLLGAAARPALGLNSKGLNATDLASDWLLLHVVYAWCQFCASESDAEASWLRQEAGKLHIVQVLVESADGHTPTIADLNSWVARAHGNSSVRFPSALDPSGRLLRAYPRPTFVLLRPKDGFAIEATLEGPGSLKTLREAVGTRR